MPRPPGPKGLPIIGMLHKFMQDPTSYLQTLSSYGDVVSVPLGNQKLVYVFHPDIVEDVLVRDRQNYSKGALIKRTKLVFGEGLVVSDGELWKRQRARMAHSFVPKITDQFAAPISERTAQHLSLWNGERELDEDFMSLTLEIALHLLFGNTDRADLEELGLAFTEISKFFASFTEHFVHLPLWIPTPKNLRFNRAFKDLEKVVSRIIQARKESDIRRPDLLDSLLKGICEGGEPMDDTQLRDEIRTLLLAGHETTSLGLTFSAWLLAENPDVQERIASQVLQLCGNHPVNASHLPELSPVEHTFKEAMRMIPPVPAITRSPIKNVELGGYDVPKGTIMIIPQLQIHNDPRFFEKPKKFNPERWADTENLKRFAYFPFGGGPRVCIGARMAMMEGTLILAELLRRFRLEKTQESVLDLMPSITFRPKTPVKLRLVPRSHVG